MISLPSSLKLFLPSFPSRMSIQSPHCRNPSQILLRTPTLHIKQCCTATRFTQVPFLCRTQRSSRCLGVASQQHQNKTAFIKKILKSSRPPQPQRRPSLGRPIWTEFVKANVLEHLSDFSVQKNMHHLRVCGAFTLLFPHEPGGNSP